MKGKTKGERKNKSIKKNQIPAFILTGGEWDEKKPAENMTEAVTHVENLIKNCKGQNDLLIKQQQDLIGKLKGLQIQIDDLNLDDYERLKKEKSDIDGKMETLENDKVSLEEKVAQLTQENQQIGELQQQIDAAKKKKEDEDLKREDDEKLKKNEADKHAKLMSPDVTSQIFDQATGNVSEQRKREQEKHKRKQEEEETSQKIKMLEQKSNENREEIERLTTELNSKGAEITGLKRQLTENQADLDAKTKELEQKTTEMKTYLELLKTTYKSLMDLTGTDSGEEPQLLKDESDNNINVEEMFNAMTTKLDTATQVSKESIKQKAQENDINKENIDRLEADKIAAEKRATEAEARATNAEEKAKNAEDGSTASTAALTQQWQEKLKIELENAEGIKKEELAEAKREAETAQNDALVAVQTELSAEKEATKTAQKALESAKAETEEVRAKNDEELAAAQLVKDKALAEAKIESETALASVGEAGKKCQEDLKTAELALQEAKREAQEAQTKNDEELAAAQKELKDNNDKLLAIETQISALEDINRGKKTELTGLKQENTVLLEASKTHKDSVDQFKDQLAKCKEELEDKSATSNAGEQQATYPEEPKYDENEILQSIDFNKVEGTTLKDDFDLKTIMKSVEEPIDTPDGSDMDYVYPRHVNNIKKFTSSDIKNTRIDYSLKTHKINNGMLFLFVHDKKKLTASVINDNNRQIYICRIENIDNNNITADCWNISTSMNEFLIKYHTQQFQKNEFQTYSVTINQDDSKPIKFSTIPRPRPKGNKRNKPSNINKELPQIYKELLTPIIHKDVVNNNAPPNIYQPNHKTNLQKIKNKNIIPVYPYGEDSFILLRRRPGDPSFQESKNYIIYLTNYEKIIQKEDKNKYFPVKDNKDGTFTMLFNNNIEIRYLHTLIEYAKTHTFLKQGDITALNTYAETGFQKQQNDKPPQQEKTLEPPKKQEQTPQQKANDRLKNDAINSTEGQIGGKKNLTKEYMKGGYRYSALGMKGLTIDLSGLKGKKTRRVKKKGKTVKNKKGSRKVKKGSRKDKTKKNKRRGRTYRNKNNFF